MVVSFALGMVYMIAWGPVVQHRNGWITGGDLWGIFRGAHYVGWGFLGGVYDPTTGIVSAPGMEVLLAPVAVLSGHLRLTESFAPIFLPHPTAALLLEPIELLLVSTTVFALDALAERLGAAKGRRILLCIIATAIVWPVAAIWGHAEDCLAMSFAIYAIISALDGRWRRCGWLFGLAIVTQPLVALMIPLFVGAAPSGQRLKLLARSASLSIVLIGIAIAGNAKESFQALVQQPTPPSVNHATPWVALAPRLPSNLPTVSHAASLVGSPSGWTQRAVVTTTAHVVNVSGGPGRLIYVLLAVLLGFYVSRRPQAPMDLVWLAAAVLGMRCLFEAVMTPYYLAPPLLLALTVACCRPGRRFWIASALALVATVFAYQHLAPWLWWIPVVAIMASVTALSHPDRISPEMTGTVDESPENMADGLRGSLTLQVSP
jgi:hypothetical protein